MALEVDIDTLKTIDELGIQPYLSDDVIIPYIRGLAPDMDESGRMVDGEGTDLYNKMMHEASVGMYPRSSIGKLTAMTLMPETPYADIDYASEGPWDYIKKFQDWKNLCSIFTDIGPDNSIYEQYKVPGYEYYPDDFLYCVCNGYPLNRMITLRRFPFACIDNIFDKKTQANQDITRLIGFIDDNTNPFGELLSFQYGLNWKELTAEYEQMQMVGDQEGLTGYMGKMATVFGDTELVNNRLRGPNGNMIPPNHDQNKAHGPVDSINSTHIRDVGLKFEKGFEIDFLYRARSFQGRNPDAVMKDILANILLCTFNDGEFWGGARYWMGARPSKATNMFQWMNSDDLDTILKGAYNSLMNVINDNFGSKQSAIETLKNIVKGGIKQALASVLNTMGRPGIPYSSSLLSGSPVGSWHLTIGHPMNPIMTIGNLICENVNISFPDNTLGFGDFPTTIKATISLKPAMPLDRAGIEKIFNHGIKRIYLPTAVPVVNGRSKGRKRSLVDKTIDKVFGEPGKASQAVANVANTLTNTMASSVGFVNKWANGDKETNIWVSKTYDDKRNKISQGVSSVEKSFSEKLKEGKKNVSEGANVASNFVQTEKVLIVEKGKDTFTNAKDMISRNYQSMTSNNQNNQQ